MSFSKGEDIYLIGNQYIRNQDSSAVVLVKTNADGNQLWSRKFFGKGYTTSKSILLLPSNDLLILAAGRAFDESRSIPVLYRVNEQGDLLNEYFIEEEQNSSTSLSSMPEDMVLGESGEVFLLGNMRGVNGISQKSFIKKVEIQSGKVLDQRIFSNSEITEAKKIFRNGKDYLVIGDTRQEIGQMTKQNIFLASFSANLVEAGHSLIGSPENDTFKKAIVNSHNELVILSSEESTTLTPKTGMIKFIDLQTKGIKMTVKLDYGTAEVSEAMEPEAITEDENGEYYVAVNTLRLRAGTNIFINKLDASGFALWSFPREIGGDGNDRVAQIKMKDGYVYMLSTIDMQNENTLISLSKIRF